MVEHLTEEYAGAEDRKKLSWQRITFEIIFIHVYLKNVYFFFSYNILNKDLNAEI